MSHHGQAYRVLEESELMAVVTAASEAVERQVVGYKFRGAIPEAEHAGYGRRTSEASLFISLFLNAIPDSIETDDDGRIV